MVVINEEKCIGCGKCATDCISGTIRIREGKAKARQGCLLCGHCLAVCPADAVQIEEYEDTVRTYNSSSFDISEENMLNAIMFRRSIRNYTDKKIGKEQLEKLIMAGSHTATAKNRQEIGYIFVQDHLDQRIGHAIKDPNARADEQGAQQHGAGVLEHGLFAGPSDLLQFAFHLAEPCPTGLLRYFCHKATRPFSV